MVAVAKGRMLCVGKELSFCTNVTKNDTAQGLVPGGEEGSRSLYARDGGLTLHKQRSKML